MSTPHVDEALRKAARLRTQVAELEPRPLQRPSLGKRVARRLRRLVVFVVVVLLAAVGVFAYNAVQTARTSRPSASSAANAPTYSELKVFDEAGSFAGRVAITNPFDHDISVLVRVNVYDGDQAVGEISGLVTLKPSSTSRVALTGLDPFSPFTDTRVHLSGFSDPAS